MDFHHDPSLLITAPFTAPPASVVLGTLESNTSAPFFAEQQNVTLSGAATINASAAGTYDSPGDLIAGSLAAGTYLSSWYLHFDKIGGGNTTVFLAGSITFDSDILGVVLLDPDLLDTDVLGAPVTTYPAAGRQFDLDLGDVFSISADHRTLAFRAGTSSGADVLRIFVAGSSGVLEPRAWRACSALALHGLRTLPWQSVSGRGFESPSWTQTSLDSTLPVPLALKGPLQ